MISENELAARLGLSRTPIREALIELSKVGIVEIYPQKGSRISLIDPVMVEQAYFMRETLECEVIRQVCALASPADLDRLSAIIHDQERFVETDGAGSEVSFMALDNRFHGLLFEIAQKTMVFSIIQEIVIHFDRVRHMMIGYSTPADVTRQHQEILAAIRDRDGQMAAALTHRHLGSFKDIQDELVAMHPDYFTQ